MKLCWHGRPDADEQIAKVKTSAANAGRRRHCSPKTPTPRPANPRRRLFRVIALALPFVLLALLEAAFRLVPGLNEDRDPYVNISPVSAFSHTFTNGQEYYNITHSNILGGESVHFPVKKPANTFRVFCLGSSACAGWPHARDETFSAYLQQALQNAYPGMTIEVINAAGHGFPAYRTRRLLDEVVKMDPDLLLVWEGNNEFLEDRNYAPPQAGLVALASHLRTVQWLRLRFAPETQLSGAELNDLAKFFRAKTQAQALRLRADPVQFSQVQAHFHESFEHMVRQAERYHVPLILCTCPVNLRDWLPTVSTNRLAGAPLEQWQKLYYAGRRGLLTGDLKGGIDAMRKAIALEELHAESYYWLGRLLDADGQRDAAWEAFSKARDLDYNPFRALSSFNDVIRTIARDNQDKGVYLLDLDRMFASASEHAAPGFDFFLDYVHPTKPANMMVALRVYHMILREGWLPGQPAVDTFTYRERPFGPHGEPFQDKLDPDLQIVVAGVAAQNRQLQKVLDESAELMRLKLGRPPTGPDDPEFAQVPPEFAERYRVFWHYLDVERRVIMDAGVTQQEQDDARRQLEAYYDKAYPYGRL